VVALDDPRAALETVKRVRERFPELKILARARSRTEAYEFAAMGVPAVRELFAGSLDAAKETLEMLGYDKARAQRIVHRFRQYDEDFTVKNAPHRHDVSKLIALTEQGRRDLQQLLAAEAQSAPQIHENNAAADEERRDDEAPGERLREKHHPG